MASGRDARLAVGLTGAFWCAKLPISLLCAQHGVSAWRVRMATSASSSASDRALLESQAVYGCELIEKMGILLRLQRVCVSTAQVSFHRFYA